MNGGRCARSKSSEGSGESVRITLPMPMKTLRIHHWRTNTCHLRCEPTYLKVAPDPTMYFPNVLITPEGPAPYWNIVTVPLRC